MPAVTRTPRARWIEAGLTALARGGPDAVRVETLAAELGVTKGGFYGYFPDRIQFMAAVLDEWEQRSTDHVLAQVEAEGGDAAAKIRRAGALTFGKDLLAVDLAVRAWARTAPEVALRLTRVDNRRMQYLREQFAAIIDDPDEIEARSTLAFTLVIGQHFMAAEHGNYSRHQAVDLAAALLVAH